MHHLLSRIQAPLSPSAYEMLVVMNMPLSASTVMESSHWFHATMNPTNSLNPNFAH